MLIDWLRAVRLTAGYFQSFGRQRPMFSVLGQRWTHHGAHSGYLIDDALCAAVPRNARILPHPIGAWISSRVHDPYWEQRYLIQLILRVSNTRVLHIVDGDFDAWAYRNRPRWLRPKITATFHQPTDTLKTIVSDLEHGMLDGIICVSRDQIPVLKHLVPEGRCVFIPHGVDADFFNGGPESRSEAPPLLLSVGVHRRDFKTLIEASRLIKRRRPDVRVLLVGPRDRVASVAQEGIVDTISDVSDQQLRELYQRSRILLMPLEAATANNALLEAMATGRPAVITDLPSIHDYATSDAVLFCQRGDAEAHAQAAITLLNDDGLCRRMGLAAHCAADEFNWRGVWRLIAKFLETVAAN